MTIKNIHYTGNMTYTVVTNDGQVSFVTAESKEQAAKKALAIQD